MQQPLIVDSFAGGGGASLGIAWATGRAPDIAINHDAAAIAMHSANHPDTKHFHEDVWRVSPRKVTKGRKVGLLWASPDCRHFSRAKGGKPVSKKIRSLAWVVIKWAAEVKPKLIMLENVREFADWGPLVPRWVCAACEWQGTEGQATLVRKRRRCPRCESLRLEETDQLVPNPAKIGLTFRRWKGRLEALGYTVESRNLDAADFGAPTHRKRLFVIARCDGEPIVWPEATHADPKKITTGGLFPDTRKPYRTAAECIQWSLPCPSIFERKKPLADKTLRRIALGLKRYVLDNPQPFIVGVGGPGYSGKPRPVDRPMGTLIQENHSAVVVPYVAQLAHGEGKDGRWGEGSRPVTDPLGTVHSGGNNHALVAAMLTKFHGQSVAGSVSDPVPTQLRNGHTGLVGAHLVKFRGNSEGHSVDEPMPTITSGAGAARPAGAAHALGVSACYLARFNHGNKQWNAVNEPLGSVTSQGNKFGLVYAFLMKFFGSGGQWGACDQPLATATAKHRFALVTVEVGPGQFEPAVAIDVPGIGPCVIADIGLRMLTPRELARAQGFPDTYLLTGNKSQQVARIGNSVCPVMAQRMVEVNWCNTLSPMEC